MNTQEIRTHTITMTMTWPEAGRILDIGEKPSGKTYTKLNLKRKNNLWERSGRKDPRQTKNARRLARHGGACENSKMDCARRFSPRTSVGDIV